MVRFLFASYFCSWTRFHVNVAVATAIHHGVCFKVTALFRDLSQGQDLEDLFDEDGGFFAAYKKTSFAVE